LIVPASVFRCIDCGAPLTQHADGASWACDLGHVFPVREGVPRFLASDELARADRTAETFGFQWTTFDVSDRAEDSAVFLEKTGLSPDALTGKLVLDAGCGGGRYAKLLGEAGAQVVALDLSSAVLHAREVTARLPNVVVVQGNLMNPPLAPQSFDVVYSLGVLHHTPDTIRAFRAIARLVKPGGYLAVWLYRRNTAVQEMMNAAVRAMTTRLPVPVVLMIARLGALAGGVPGIRHLNKLVNFSAHPRWSTRVCDTFDWYAPPFQFHHTERELLEWFSTAGFDQLRVLAPVRARGRLYGTVYRRNLLIGSGVNVAGTKIRC
jgi:SAM-dependent methyltransferase